VSTIATGSYEHKNAGYFQGAREDWVGELPDDPAAVLLDVGCGEGATGALARSRGKCGTAYGIELTSEAGSAAATVLDEVLVGDVEELDFPWATESIDILILSEVLEHLRDPWTLLRRLRPLLHPGARVFASSPNVAHHRIVRGLLRGRFRLEDFGPMDRTHLRWFTPDAYRELFEECGYAVESVGPLGSLGPRSRLVDRLTARRLTHLLHVQTELRARAGDEAR
jgi:2-polyprenyl-3-methyl-5-hydroxy-6-metoxy-1,4-benzoquinol methylase